MDRQQQEEELIPGLPEEVAMECLIRVPFDGFPAARSVCRLWRRHVDSDQFLRLRRSAGLARPVVVLAQAEQAVAASSGCGPATKYAAATPSYRLALLEPESAAWRRLPPIPSHPAGLPLFCQLAAVGPRLVVLGGWDPESWAPLDEVHVYDLRTAAWRRGARMPGPRRSFFACAAAGRKVLVAGGHDEEKNALKSAMAYDVEGDEWAPLPDMARERDECRGVFLRGGFHVIGGYATEAQGRFGRSAEAFDVDAWQWGPVEEDTLAEDGTCPRTAAAGADGRMYMCRNGHVAVREEGWRAVAELPEDARVAPQVVEWEGKLVVVGSGCHGGAQAGYVLETGPGAWRRIEVPPEYSGHVQAACCIQV